MTVTALQGPVVAYGSDAPDYNPDLGPSLFWGGSGIMDPRFAWRPGSQRMAVGWLGSDNPMVIDAVPSALSATNIATAQVPVVGTALTITAGTGISAAATLTNQSTGLGVTVYAIDTAMTPISYGMGGLTAQIGLWDPTKAISRNIRIASVGNDSTATFVVRGYDLYGFPMSETITGANVGTASGVKAFKYIASITPAGTVSGSNVTVGTGDVFGLPLLSTRFQDVQIYWNAGLISATTGYTAAVTTSPATAITGDVRGTYAVQSASDASKRLQVKVQVTPAKLVSTATLFGVAQFTS
jgi:hypothetical protein